LQKKTDSVFFNLFFRCVSIELNRWTQ
jgi:hypothetical protein